MAWLLPPGRPRGRSPHRKAANGNLWVTASHAGWLREGGEGPPIKNALAERIPSEADAMRMIVLEPHPAIAPCFTLSQKTVPQPIGKARSFRRIEIFCKTNQNGFKGSGNRVNRPANIPYEVLSNRDGLRYALLVQSCA